MSPSATGPTTSDQTNGAGKSPSEPAGDSKDQSHRKHKLPRSAPAFRDPKGEHGHGKTIVVCLDGTGDKFDDDNSNIVHFVSALKKDDPNQVTYYQAGIGTYGQQGLSGGFTAALDMAVGSELGLHVRDAYHFLMHSYKEGDRICLFGFSRGAYTARCLAGMIHKVGLLPPRNLQQIVFAYEYYKDDSEKGWKQSAEFKKTFSIDVNVYFVGVFDSVSSVGIIPRQLPLSSTPANKSRYFRHAIALDERRAKFKPCRFVDKDWSDIKGPRPGESTEHYDTRIAKKDAQNQRNKIAYEAEFEAGEDPFKTNVEEVWFLGAHADVGGGAVKNEERHKLSNISLRWMIRQCFICDTGIVFKLRPLAEIGLDVHMLVPTYKGLDVPESIPTPDMIQQFEAGLPSKKKRAHHLKAKDHDRHGNGHYDLHIPGTDEEHHPEWMPEQIEDWFDAQSPVNDQLVQARTWWVLEVYPVQYKMQKAESDEWVTVTGMNLGRYRGVDESEPKMHWTVRARMDRDKEYKLQARYGRNAKWQLVA